MASAKKRGPRRIDWLAVRRDYVEGIQRDDKVEWPTLQELCKLHRISMSAVGDKAMEEDWTGERKKYQKRVEEKRRAVRADKLGNAQAEFDNRVMRVAESQLAMIIRAMTEATQGEGAKINPSDLPKLTRALRDVHAVGQAILGVPPPGWQGQGMNAPGKPQGNVRQHVVYQWIDDDPTDETFD